MNNNLYLGCVADDFTGAGDFASFLAAEGIKTVMCNGVPEEELDEDCEAIVIALKTRTAKTDEAVTDSLKAFAWLRERGAEKFYIKYCSTFDSTREGNIGPILDAVMEAYQIPYTVICPSLPVNNRIVRDGRLYVNGVPLDESPMRNHPLTPMWESDISRLLEPQSRFSSIKISTEELNHMEKLREKAEIYSQTHKHFYIIPDYSLDVHGKQIVEAFHDISLFTGGSGLAAALGAWIRCHGRQKDYDKSGLILAGSCSVATLGQIRDFQEKGGISFRLDPGELMTGDQTFDMVLDFIREHIFQNVLIYSSDEADKVKSAQAQGKESVADMLESIIAKLALEAVKSGKKRIIVAGGETSGAVTRALGFQSYKIGKSIAPGVPIMRPIDNPSLRLVLKSGNFGQPDFFTKALEMTEEE